MTTATKAPSSTANTPKHYFATIGIDEITSFPYNYRKDFDETALGELAVSIGNQGIIEPLIVHRVPSKYEGDQPYFGICGERRWRAAKLAGLQELPCIVHEGISDKEAIEIALVENLQRKDVNPMEEAAGYAMLRDAVKLKQADIAERVGRPRSTIANALRLLELPVDVREAIAAGKLTKAHGIALMRFKGYDRVINFIAERAILNKTPAGTLEQGLPWSIQLCQEGLAYGWDHFSINAQWYPVRAAVIAKARKEDKDRGWFEEDDGDIYVLDEARGEAVQEALLAEEKKAEEAAKAKAAQASNDDEEDEAPQESEEARERRLAYEKEQKEREEKHDAELKRAHKWWEQHDKKGPTGGSSIKDWDPILKAFFLLTQEFFDYIDIDDDILKEYLPNGFTLPDEPDDPALLKALLKVPGYQLLEMILRDQVFNGLSNNYWTTRLTQINNALEGKEVEL